MITISCVIPAKDRDDPKLKDLLASIRAQKFPQDEVETIVVTEGDSEQAKAIGIRQARGEIIAMFCADNMLMDRGTFHAVYYNFRIWKSLSAVYPRWYHVKKDDNSLNRYFALIGGNDPVCYYLGKNDRDPHVASLKRTSDYQPSYGCNGFFYRAEHIKATNLDHYYPMDNAMEVPGDIQALQSDAVWHRTADNLWTTLRKRYRYARDLYCDREDRRWRMLDTPEDRWGLAWFVLATITVIPNVFQSLKGFRGIKDPAWFWHPVVSLGFLLTYGLLTCRNLLVHRSLFRVSTARSPLQSA